MRLPMVLLGAITVACGSVAAPPSAAVTATPAPAPAAALPSPQPSAGPLTDPVRLEIPSIGVNARVIGLGLDSHGDLGVPGDALSTAWYTGSARPGEPGNAVVNGHVDWYTGDSVFARLRELRTGDAVIVTTSTGVGVRFAVSGQKLYAADAHPAEVFARGGLPTLRLVTCGGPFNVATRRFEQRLVVTAALETIT